MNCNEVHKQILFFAEATAPENQRQEIQKHLTVCDACNSLYVNIRKNLEAIETEKTNQSDELFFEQLQAKLHQKHFSTRSSSLFVMRQIIEPLKIAAVIALGIFLGVLIGNSSEQTAQTTQPQIETYSLEDEFTKEIYFTGNDLAYESVEEYLTENEVSE